jgi:hypothetical protein
MKNLFLLVFILQLSCLNVVGQESSEVYVRVPKKFSFLKENNQYQLNALTAFLFEKSGFKPIYKNEGPTDVHPCSIYQADVHDESNLFTTKLYITLVNCNSKIVYRSPLGVSKEKDYKRAYHEALREAAKNLQHEEQKLRKAANEYSSGNKKESRIVLRAAVDSGEARKEVIIDPQMPVPQNQDTRQKDDKQVSERSVNALPTVQYWNQGEHYILEAISTGYKLILAKDGTIFATMLESGRGENYLFSSDNLKGNAFFDPDGNLLVEYLNPEKGILETKTFERRDQ